MGPFDDPAHGTDHEPGIRTRSIFRGGYGIVQRAGRAIGSMTYHCNAKMVRLLDGICIFPAIGVVGMEPLEARALVASLRHHGCRRIRPGTLAAVTGTAMITPIVSTTR